MPTENRSSNTEKLAILPMWVIDRIKEEMRLGPAAWQAIADAVEQAETPHALPCEVKLPPGTVIVQGSPVSTLLMAIAQRSRQPSHAQVFSSEPTAPQPHPEPIAWMVGTAIWWTKEEAERDAAATGLPVVGLGPMTDPGDVEQLREVIKHSDAQIMRQSMRISNQRAQLAELDALLQRMKVLFRTDDPFDLYDAVCAALSASAEPQVKS
ncbi:hypothetical protein [Pseudomonas sp. NBRC 111133]|uniref:hypothetical protein n=1 Tax=Pseudomonas sp. NBRC 111133 TaxID=1661048 RepID=UPI0007621D1B|nr:hypothetical protein [Pseudomonas sp. NBRC 111133]